MHFLSQRPLTSDINRLLDPWTLFVHVYGKTLTTQAAWDVNLYIWPTMSCQQTPKNKQQTNEKNENKSKKGEEKD